MVGGWLGERERPHGKAPMDSGDDSSTGEVIALSDSDSVGSTDAERSRENAKLKKVVIDLVSERQKQDVLDKELARLLVVFPNASPRVAAADLASQLRKTSPQRAFERIIHRYMEHGVPEAEHSAPKAEQVPREVPREVPKPDPLQATVKPVDIFASVNVHRVGTSNHGERQVDSSDEMLPPEIKANYNLWTYYNLVKEFPRYPIPELKRVLHENNNRFTPSFMAISSDYSRALVAEQSGPVRRRGRRFGSRQLNLRAREAPPKPQEPCYIFERELQNLQKAGVKLVLDTLRKSAGPQCGTQMDACEGETSADIECGCCCSDYRFEEMVQCAEGHLFCFTCLRRRIEESTFGGSQASNSLPCMDTSGCEESFPWSEVKRALPPDVLAKYEQRQAEDAVVQAKIPGLVYCPFCNTPWEVDPDVKVLDCANESCQKASCVLCREPNHLPLRCEEVEKKSETSMRRSIEERMTKALIRVCSACKAELLKSDGCNKVTCRCGKTMCYVCRQPIAANYQHFCQHSRPGPKKPCTICKKCSLWEEEEEDQIVKEAREAAMKELAQDDPNLLKRTIGPTLETGPKKKPRPPPIPAIPFRPPPPEYYNIAAQAMVHVFEQML